ncbi:MAG: hypothetical protein ACXVRK_03540, partial [Gaiellaceae bacterium]
MKKLLTAHGGARLAAVFAPPPFCPQGATAPSPPLIDAVFGPIPVGVPVIEGQAATRLPKGKL